MPSAAYCKHNLHIHNEWRFVHIGSASTFLKNKINIFKFQKNENKYSDADNYLFHKYEKLCSNTLYSGLNKKEKRVDLSIDIFNSTNFMRFCYFCVLEICHVCGSLG
jgi:hypothetical protein